MFRDVSAIITTIVVVFAALGDMASPVIVGHVSIVCSAPQRHLPATDCIVLCILAGVRADWADRLPAVHGRHVRYCVPLLLHARHYGLLYAKTTR